MPKSLSSMKRTVENIKDPLYRFFEREVNLGCKILNMVRMDLKDIYMICRGEKKQTNDHRKLISDLTRGIIPKSWEVDYKIPRDTTVNQWINDFCQRARQLDEISRTVSSNGASLLRSSTVWLGGLFNPEAYITATRQCVAQANSWSLEELYLDVCVADEADQPSFDDCSFAVEGLKLSGAVCRGNQLAVSNEISTNLHLTRLRWVRNTEDNPWDSNGDSGSLIQL